MRMLMKATLPTPEGNAAIENGTLPKVIGETMDRLKPEAAYFTLENGQRTALMVFDMTDSSNMPVIGEPLFLKLGAHIELTPVMNAEDLRAGLGRMSG